MFEDEKMMASLFDKARKTHSVYRTRIVGAIWHKSLREPIIASNSTKTHPFQARYARNIHATKLHAENNLILKALRVLEPWELRRATMYLARARINPITHVWETGNCCPCEGCQRALATYGVGEVRFTLDGSGVASMRFN